MFDYLTSEELSDITEYSLENFVNRYFKEKEPELRKRITDAQEKIISRNKSENLWRDLSIHYFGLPQPYYLGSEEVFLYFYGHKQKIADFLKSTALDEPKMEAIHHCAIDSNKSMLAVCYSLSLVERYKAAGHLVCVNTYQTLLKHCHKDMRGLYATQAYFHSLQLQSQFRESKQIWMDLGWKAMFKESYGKPKEFVTMVLSHVKPYLTQQEQRLAEQLAAHT